MSSTIGPKDPEEIITILFDFTARAGNRTITSGQATVAVSVIEGTDPAPSSLLLGAPTYPTVGQVQQRLTGGVTGVWYMLRCKATLSDGDILVAAAQLLVDKA